MSKLSQLFRGKTGTGTWVFDFMASSYIIYCCLCQCALTEGIYILLPYLQLFIPFVFYIIPAKEKPSLITKIKESDLPNVTYQEISKTRVRTQILCFLVHCVFYNTKVFLHIVAVSIIYRLFLLGSLVKLRTFSRKSDRLCCKEEIQPSLVAKFHFSG